MRNLGCIGFVGGICDGKYIYLVPNSNGQVLRYLTTATLETKASYAVYNLQANVGSNCYGFQGAAFDGQQIYFVPNVNGQFTTFNTTGTFLSASSYTTYNLQLNINSGCYGFIGAVYDGTRYVYLCPNSNGQITRFDTTGTFTATSSYVVFDTQSQVSPNSYGFSGGAFDGRYLYLAPNSNGQITRFDTTGSFTATSSYAVFDTRSQVSSSSCGFSGAVFDGRYVYFIPEGTAGTSGQITRFDTTGSFTTTSSYVVFDTAAQVSSDSCGFTGGVFDGRYLYLVPNRNGTSGQATRYDTTAGFTVSTSYTVFSLQTSVNSACVGFEGAVCDGLYVYFVPNRTGRIASMNTYAGPSATVIAAFQAPNGFVTGTYAGVIAPPTNGLLVGGNTQIHGNLTTAPSSSQSSSLSLGSPYENSFGYDAVLTVYLNISAASGGSLLSGVGSTGSATPQVLLGGVTTTGLVSVPIYLPSGYYARISGTGGITATVLGQQVTPV